MNDIEEAFAYQREGLDEKRDRANKYLPRIGKLFDETKDPELIQFMQEVMDAYMMHECKLGRRP